MTLQEIIFNIIKIYAVIVAVEIVIIAIRYFRADDSKNSKEAILKDLEYMDSEGDES